MLQRVLYWAAMVALGGLVLLLGVRLWESGVSRLLVSAGSLPVGEYRDDDVM